MKISRKHSTMAFLLIAMATIVPVHAHSNIKDQAKEVEVQAKKVEVSVEPTKTEMLWVYAKLALLVCVIVAYGVSKPGSDRDNYISK